MLFFNLRLSVSGECRLMTANATVVCVCVCVVFFLLGAIVQGKCFIKLIKVCIKNNPAFSA